MLLAALYDIIKPDLHRAKNSNASLRYERSHGMYGGWFNYVGFTPETKKEEPQTAPGGEYRHLYPVFIVDDSAQHFLCPQFLRFLLQN